MKLTIKKVAYLVAATMTLPASAWAHGALSYPESRQWICSSGATPNLNTPWGGGNKLVCQQIFQKGYSAIATDWSGVARGNAAGRMNQANYQQDPRSAHIAVMGGMNAPVCSSNNTTFAPLDDTKNYDWFSHITTIETGSQTFVYAASAPHNTYGNGYVDFYITKSGWDKSKPLTWNDLEAKPFCHWTPSSSNSPLQNGSGGRFEDINCAVPANKTGQQVIFAIWQRNDSDEAFYSCSDVNVVSGDTPPPVENTWQPFYSDKGVAKLPNYENLEIGDVITFTLNDKATLQHVYQTHISITANNINQWQAVLAAQVNHAQSEIAVGELNPQSQQVTPVATDSSVYAMPARLHDRVWSIELQHQQPIDEKEWQPLAGTNGQAEIGDIQGINSGDSVVFRLFRQTVNAYGVTSGAQDADTIRLDITDANKGHWQYALAQKFNAEAKARDVVALGVYHTVSEQVIPSATQVNRVYLHVDTTHTLDQYSWVIDYHKAQSDVEDTYQPGYAYKAGDVVVLDGQYYECKPWPYTAWCASAAYRPNGTYGDQAWTLLGDTPDPVVPTPVDPVEPTDPSAVDAWQASQVYQGGDQAQYNGQVYEAKWWTRGDNPAQNSGAWDVWKKIN